ncbi:MAG: DUF305 domain-containing protein [Actinobacteria bacterium]|nr:DUF305 domain-containing protein [Actinomycetota bacterium]
MHAQHAAVRPLRSLRRSRAVVAGAALLGLALTLTACGETDPSPSRAAVSTASDGTEFNQADIDFATRMIPHHAQAVEMVVMAQGRDLSSPVATLMEDIRTAQVPEIETMADWLITWGEPVPETSLDHANAENGHMSDMDGMDGMEGMMSAAEMDELDASSDADFEALWLTMMEQHHAGAIAMAESEVEDGHNPEAVGLAEAIITAQTSEIAIMKDLQ